MKVQVNKTVSYDISHVDIAPVTVAKDPTGALVFMVFFRWLDSNNALLKQASNRYTQAQIVASATDHTQATTLLTALAGLFVDGIAPALRITVPDSGNVSVQAFHSEMVGEPPVKTFMAKNYTENDLIAVGLSSAIISGLVSQIANTMT